MTQPSEALRLVLLDSISDWGGGQKWDLQAALAWTGRGHRVAIACARGSMLEQRARAAGLPVWSAPVGRFGWRLGSSCALARFLRRERIQFVIANVGRDVRLGALATRGCGAALLQRRGILRPLRGDPLNRFLYRRVVERVIVMSEAVRRSLLVSAPFLDAERVVRIPNAIDTSRPLRGDGRRLRAELGIPLDVPLVGSVGRLVPMKGFEHLLRAWPSVLEAHPRAHLVVVGGGPLRDALAQEVERLGLGERVVLAGFRDQTDDLYEAIDVFVLPSVKYEGISNAVLEAMAHARPVVVTDYEGGVAEPVTPRGAGCVVPVGDERALAAALRELLADPEARTRMGRAGRETIQADYTLEHALDRWEQVLRELRPRATERDG